MCGGEEWYVWRRRPTGGLGGGRRGGVGLQAEEAVRAAKSYRRRRERGKGGGGWSNFNDGRQAGAHWPDNRWWMYRAA